MTAFFALLRLQLLSRYSDMRPKNWKYLDSKKRKHTIGMICLYVFLVLYLGGFLFFVETKAVNLLVGMGRPPIGMADLMIIAAVAISMIGTLIMSFFFVMSSLYLGRDSAFLASLPLKPRTVLSAKMVQICISETLINALILIPACILFGVHTGQGPGFYLRMILVWLCSAMIPISIGAIFSSLLVHLTALFRHREAIMTVGGLALMVVYFYISMNIGSMTGDSATGGEMLTQLITSYSARISGFTRIFPPAGWAVYGMLGDIGQLLIFIGASVATFVLLIWVLGFRYRKLSLLQTEAPVAAAKKGIQKDAFRSSGNALTALCKREILQILRVPSYATNILPISFMPAIMVVMMGVFMGKNLGDGSESLQALLREIPGPLALGVLTAFMCFMAGMNSALSTSVSREGRGHDLMLSLPVPSRVHLRSKLIVGYGLSVLGIALTAVALVVLFPGLTLEALLSCVLCLLFNYIFSCLALARDVKKPRLNWVTEQEAVKQNFGVMISMLLSWAALAALALISYLLIAKLNFDTWPYFGTMAALLAAGCFAARAHLMKTGDKYYTAQ